MNPTELEKTNDLIAIWPADEKFVNFTWQVSDVCNFKCSYCNPGNYGAISKNLDVERYKNVLDQMIESFFAQGYKHFKFFFSGGEPTIWPPMIEVCKHIKKRIPAATIGVNTNLSRSPKWWKENYIYFDDVVASFHVEGCNREIYLQNAEFLQYRLGYLACRMLLHDERFQEVVEFSELLKLRLKNCVIEYAALFEHLSPHSEMYFYKDEWKREFIRQNTYFSKREVEFSFLGAQNKAHCYEVYSDGSQRALNATRVIGENRNRFKGWKCWINDSIFIGPSGNIQLASCGAAKTIGNINAGPIEISGEPVICPLKSCGCGTDINIRKVNIKHEHQLEKENLSHG